ncbi:MAG: thiamine phosphate synthase [Pirellulaceae bacterium]
MLNDEQRASVLRVLDANVNRASEGLRTIEDVARLVCEDAVAAEWMKCLRHELAEACAQLDRSERLAARCTQSDAGTQITTTTESLRADFVAVVQAAAERITQSLRNLEEFSKFISATMSERLKQTRYAAYDLLAKTELRLCRDRPTLDGRLMLLVDCGLDVETFRRSICELSVAGVDYFQLRDKAAEGGRLMQYARAAMDALKESSSRVIINDRLDIALASGAMGVHLGQDDLGLRDAISVARGKLLIGISTHCIAEAIAAEAGGADYIGCGPTFPSQTKQFEEFPGPAFLRKVAERISLPAFAIGGVDMSNVQEIIAAGCRRIAVSGAVHQAEQPLRAVAELRNALAENHIETG